MNYITNFRRRCWNPVLYFCCSLPFLLPLDTYNKSGLFLLLTLWIFNTFHKILQLKQNKWILPLILHLFLYIHTVLNCSWLLGRWRWRWIEVPTERWTQASHIQREGDPVKLKMQGCFASRATSVFSKRSMIFVSISERFRYLIRQCVSELQIPSKDVRYISTAWSLILSLWESWDLTHTFTICILYLLLWWSMPSTQFTGYYKILLFPLIFPWSPVKHRKSDHLT